MKLGLNSEEAYVLFQYASKKKWKTIRNVLKRLERQRNTGDSDNLSLIQQRDSTGLSFFSLCFGLNAPIDILSKICDLDPNQAYQVDVFGASAMHIACLNGVPLQSIASSAMPISLVSSKDADGSLPIHLLMVCLGRNEIEGTSAMDIVDWMIDVDPDILFTQDNLGFTPVDIIQSVRISVDPSSIEGQRLKSIYGHLQKAYIKCWRMKKCRWESTSHEIVKNDSMKIAKNDVTSLTSGDMSLESWKNQYIGRRGANKSNRGMAN